jgi:hypothetical protein
VLAQEGEELGGFPSFELVHVDISPCFMMILQHRFYRKSYSIPTQYHIKH